MTTSSEYGERLKALVKRQGFWRRAIGPGAPICATLPITAIFQSESLCILTIDIFPLVWYNSIRKKERGNNNAVFNDE